MNKMNWIGRIAFRLTQKMDAEQHPEYHDQERRDALWAAHFLLLDLMEDD